jgi:Arc/MetJ family transcription regulator
MKTLVDIDEEQLEAAQSELRTTTKKDTVNSSLAAVVALAARRRDLLRFRADGLPDLLDPETMTASWRR